MWSRRGGGSIRVRCAVGFDPKGSVEMDELPGAGVLNVIPTDGIALNYSDNGSRKSPQGAAS